mgnify:CR=1 FL=1
MGGHAIDVKWQRFVRRDAGQQHSDGIRNGQTHFGQDVGRFFFDMPVNPGTYDISTGHLCAQGWL